MVTDKSDNSEILIIRDKDSLHKLFNKYFQELYLYTNKIVGNHEVAEEIVQDVFITIWEKRDDLNIKSSEKGYLMAIARNKSINHIKKKYVQLARISDNEVLMVSHKNHADEQVIGDELEVLVTKAMEKIPERSRHVFSLSRYSDLTYKEIADQLGVSQKTIEYHIANALKILRTFLENHGYCLILISFAG